MSESDAIRRAAEKGRTALPAATGPGFRAVMSASAGEPALVRTPEGKAAYWLVPFLTEGLICGFARVELSRKTSQVSALGDGDRRSWLESTWFERPPADALAEIRKAYSYALLSDPVLSYDRTPARWAWKIQVRQLDARPVVVFITPGGWYTPAVPGDPEREG